MYNHIPQPQRLVEHLFPLFNHSCFSSLVRSFSSAARRLEQMIGSHGFRRSAAGMLTKLMRDASFPAYSINPLQVHVDEENEEGDIRYDFSPLPHKGEEAIINITKRNKPGRVLLPPVNTMKNGQMVPTFVICSEIEGGQERLKLFTEYSKQAQLLFKRWEVVDSESLDMAALTEQGIVHYESTTQLLVFLPFAAPI